jgi:ABC-type polysaccharide/polyol phosphate export permease
MAEDVIYDSARRIHPALEELRELINYRELILQLVRRDVLTRYKRSVLGIAWTLLNPLGMMLVLTLAFSQILRFNTLYGYAAFVLSGLIAWNFFSQSTTAAMVNLVWGGGLLSRIYIPRASFALAAIGTAMVNILLALIPLLLVNVITGVPITPAFLFVPVPLLLLACFSLGLGLLLSTSAVYFPDVAEMYQIALSAWFYLTPIIYPIEALPEQLQFWIRFNPMYQLLNLFRLSVYYGRFPTWDQLWPSLFISLLTLILGWVLFSRKSNEFGYRI